MFSLLWPCTYFQGHCLVNGISFETMDGFSSNLHRRIVVTSLRAY